MPTEAERVCYQLPAAVQGGVTVVLSLLVSLIYDKFTKLDDLGIPSRRLWPAAENIRKVMSPHAPNHTPLHDSREGIYLSEAQ
ncbi:Bloom syndrome protein -like protein [Caligus rogercresseyi]|uniref:Bloom syndrome protein -like protein n=1 Tax=Caligus rogercresseyi TaxID=217165 RepID=A0A7T8GPD0_CALRO|nr:Bloom syndrome protein -like protein [Caligus rogercresseyi]